MIHQQIAYIAPEILFSQFADQAYAIWLDSSRYDDNVGRYSFIAIEPFITLSSKNGLICLDKQQFSGNPFNTLNELLKQYPQDNISDLPPFQGGVAGYFAYDLYQHLEDIPKHRLDDANTPDMIVGFYDLVISFDHQQQKTWIISSGYPEKNMASRQQRAKQRLDWLQQQLSTTPSLQAAKQHRSLKQHLDSNGKLKITSNFTQTNYQQTIQKTMDYIYAGDIFQANIAQRFSTSTSKAKQPFALYQQLRCNNPAPFSAFLNFPDVVIASSSPERFLKVDNKMVETRPIKGTRKRLSDPLKDKALAHQLLQSEKDFAENTMIVDLMRNDLSRVCQPGSIKVPQLCGLESYQTVHHLVSVVNGQLKADKSCIDLLTACFPGGSITGAPKIRAMQIIAELEPQQRGPYCGSIGYIGFNQTMDTSIVIRTYVIKNDAVYYHAGGGIVADSDPHDEYLETLTKANALERTLTDE